MCETISAGKLVLAAEMPKDEKILIEIRRKDPFALEVRYHLGCYRNKGVYRYNLSMGRQRSFVPKR